MEVQIEIIIWKLDWDRLKLIWRRFTSAKEYFVEGEKKIQDDFIAKTCLYDFFWCIMNLSFLAVLLLSYLQLLSLLELCGMVQQLQLNYLVLFGSNGIRILPSKNI